MTLFYRIFLGFWVLLVFVCHLQGQDISSKYLKCYKKAQREIRQGAYSGAEKKLTKILKKYPDFLEAREALALVFYNEEKYKNSLDILEPALSADQGILPSIYYLAANNHLKLGHTAEALSLLKHYIDLEKNNVKRQKVEDLMQSISFVSFAKQHPVPFDPEPVIAVNTHAEEYAPVMMIDGSAMIFTRRVNGQEDFFRYDILSGTVAPIDELNTIQNEGVSTVSADGKVMIFTACDRPKEGYGSCDLYYTIYKEGKWSKAKNLGQAINSRFWEAQPSLSADGATLYFSSNRKGNNDIYMSKLKDRRWSEPVPLPKTINTPDNEESPFIHPDGKTLYFRSDGHTGMGGFDIFMSKYDEESGQWSKAKNLGYPINTGANEGALCVSLNGQKAYFASDNKTGMGKHDIYSFDLYEAARPTPTTFAKIIILDAQTNKPLMADYSIIALDDSYSHHSKTGTDGIALMALPAGKNYAFFAEKNGYIHHSENFPLDGSNTAIDPYLLTVKLQKLPEEKKSDMAEPVRLNNIFFETGSAVLLPESLPEVKKLAELLKTHPNHKVLITGHTDNVGKDMDNMILSEQRAQAVVDALVLQGISRDRISSKGYGETQPIATNDTPQGRKTNRRVEFLLIKE